MDLLEDHEVRALLLKMDRHGVAWQGGTAGLVRLIEWAKAKLDQPAIPVGSAYQYLDAENALLKLENEAIMDTLRKTLGTLQGAMDSIDIMRSREEVGG